MKTKLEPLGDRLIVRPTPAEEVSAGGVILPDAAQEKSGRGEVIAVGNGAVNEDGSLRPLRVSEGDTVLYSKYGGTELEVDGEAVLVLRESDVLACCVEVAS